VFFQKCVRRASAQLFCFAAMFLLAFTALGWPSQARAQEQWWIQVESHSNIRDTRDRAQYFAARFPETRAFLTSTRWYAIVIGPYTNDEANTLIARLKSEHRIPADSIISNGNTHLSQLWPLEANLSPPVNTAPAGDVTPPASVTSQPETTTPTSTASTPKPPLAKQNQEGQTATTETAPAPVNGAVKEAVAEVPQGPLPDPDLKATRAQERGWTRETKKQYQTYMVWTGDYKSTIDGSYGRGTRSAIRGFQKREGFETTGYLSTVQVALLTKRYNDILASLGVETVRDIDAGVEILMPVKLVEFGRFDPPFVHYKSKPGSTVRVDLISQPGGRDVLRSLYDIMGTFDYVPKDGYRVRKRDWFVLSGRNDSVVSYTYAKLQKGLIKGFTLVWTPDIDAQMKQVANAMYQSFSPLDNYVLDETRGYGQGKDQPVNLTDGIDTVAPDHSATGFYISAAGDVLTHASNVRECRRITIGDGIEMATTTHDRATETALLHPIKPFTPKSYALFSTEPQSIGTEITVSGFSFPDVMDVATLNYGTLTAMTGMRGDKSRLRVSAFLEAGDVGGPVLDARGAVIGMQLLRGSGTANLPEYVNFAIRSSQLMGLLDKQSVSYGRATTIDPVAPEDLAYMASDFTVKVSCWK